ncbi:gluconate 2-dehydrogenase subunit 3 family protein [Foetidibacter luteolus]|uniref:gluconate 2-dehydrogenase subunit 3 family protein n=1 Tax=Foetidibacter luteolus TaxID=2608880 RepID=UPI00129AF44B|nr:gluconate 2-dehydrogenase subunit 3 family protein [Foetidibacter luteolus]
MDRRKSLKALVVGTVSTGVLLDACKPGDKQADGKTAADVKDDKAPAGRMKEEIEIDKALQTNKFFTAEELATITVLCDIIIPKDDVSGSASDAKVPEFIDHIITEMDEHQTPLRGGLRWLDLQCFNRYNNAFKNCTQQQQIEIVDQIAYPKKAKPEMAQGVAFFSLVRNLTATGFYTSEIGTKDVGYMGNVPNNWNGVPDDVLKQYGLAYTEKELKECVSFT